MRSRLALHPDLNACELEARCLLSYTPATPDILLTSTAGFVIPSVPPNLSVALYAAPYQVDSPLYPATTPNASTEDAYIGGDGGDVATIFRSTGFGLSEIVIGDNLGFAIAVPLGLVTPNISANVLNPAPAGPSGGVTHTTNTAPVVSVQGYGSTFSSGFSYALNSTNNYGMTNYGMTLAQIGSVPLHQTADSDDGSEVGPFDTPENANAPQGRVPSQQSGRPATHHSGQVPKFRSGIHNKARQTPQSRPAHEPLKIDPAGKAVEGAGAVPNSPRPLERVIPLP